MDRSALLACTATRISVGPYVLAVWTTHMHSSPQLQRQCVLNPLGQLLRDGVATVRHKLRWLFSPDTMKVQNAVSVYGWQGFTDSVYRRVVMCLSKR
ncbi:hypothetical protein GQ53DRAFT_747555 [Thozetella sp. PMI_491]|nr:hypothetical protein GQ53DRAFT_747555 [Thozetella sp. PMI_491]